ncbi:MAG: hypothetical protein OXT09_14970 [Myxococcales bacterium]|nr:hypothetical protein [Myxococcales bacterium]
MGRALRVSIPLLLLFVSACAPEGPTAFVTFNVPPSNDCVYMPSQSGDLFIPRGLFDISEGGRSDSDSDYCARSYNMNLQVNSFLRSSQDEGLGRAEPNILQLHSAEVTLMTLEKVIIHFDRPGEELPNPFLVTTNNSIFTSDGKTPALGIAPVEAIPAAYAPQLDGWIGNQILVQVQIFGTTTGDVDIDLKPFVYPVEICSGCLTICREDLGSGLSIDDLIGDQCDDNAGADDRFCIDPCVD